MERTLGEIKKIIEQHKQVPLDQQLIVHDCYIFDRVEDAKTLAALGMKANAELEVILRHNTRDDIDGFKAMRMQSKVSAALSSPPRRAYTDSNSEVVVGQYRPM